MNKLFSHNAKATIRIRSFRWQSWLHVVCEPDCQVNLLSALIIVALIAGTFSGMFTTLDRFQISTLVLALMGLIAVPFVNHTRKTELASILFYFALNLVSLVTFQLFQASPVETVLMYVFLLSLIVFLFQTLTTRITSMLIVLIRITIYTINVDSLGAPAGATSVFVTPAAHLIYDGILLSLLVLVFVLYGWKMYTSEDRNQKKTVFGQHMSHDLQVSFKALSSTIEILKYNHDTKGTTDPVLIDEVIDASKFYAYILGNFLDFSRAENVQVLTNHIEAIDLATELETLVDLYKYTASENGVQILLDMDDRLPSQISFDKVKIIRIVLNLLTNAVNNTDRGKTIKVSVNWGDSDWVLTVANDGNPIPEEDIHNMFLPYDSGGLFNSKKRLGLGLPITKNLVDALGGRISASSQEGMPTIFTVAFPKI